MQGIPNVGPVDVGASGLAEHGASGLPLQLHAQTFTKALPLGTGFPEVSDGGSASAGELDLSVSGEAVKVIEQHVHAHSIPKGKVKSIPLSHLPLSKRFGQLGMDTQSHRKQRLRELINATSMGVISVFAAVIGRDDSYVSRMLYPMEKAGAKPIADKMMLVIEEAFKLPRAWLDMPLGAALPQSDFSVKTNDEGNSHRVGEPVPRYIGGGPPPKGTWPFERITPAQYSALSTSQKYHVEDTIFVLLGVEQEEPEKSGATERRKAGK
jgi:hypothetical protein